MVSLKKPKYIISNCLIFWDQSKQALTTVLYSMTQCAGANFMVTLKNDKIVEDQVISDDRPPTSFQTSSSNTKQNEQ